MVIKKKLGKLYLTLHYWLLYVFFLSFWKYPPHISPHKPSISIFFFGMNTYLFISYFDTQTLHCRRRLDFYHVLVRFLVPAVLYNLERSNDQTKSTSNQLINQVMLPQDVTYLFMTQVDIHVDTRRLT